MRAWLGPDASAWVDVTLVVLCLCAWILIAQDWWRIDREDKAREDYERQWRSR